MPELPSHPSAEHLRKEAKRFAKLRSIRLARAQRLLAVGYGFRDWATLMQHVASVAVDAESPSALFVAVREGNLGAVRSALSAGGNPRRYGNGQTPLHMAARSAPGSVVEALIEGGALEWQLDDRGRTALELARIGTSPDRDAIVALLDRAKIDDLSFRAAVAALHAGDVALLGRLLDAEPRLLTERIVGPDVYRKRTRSDYFRDPKLFWFVANNPTTVECMAPNIVDVARAMIERGVERVDLDYTLELVMSSSAAREQRHQLPLLRALLAAGAVADRRAIVVAAAHCELEPLRELLACGMSIDASLAATFGDIETLRRLLPEASQETIALAFGLAVINRQHEAVRSTLLAGADVDAFLPIHSHGTPLHQAAANDDVEMIELLLQAGARVDAIDKLWEGTALEWARHAHNAAAVAALSN